MDQPSDVDDHFFGEKWVSGKLLTHDENCHTG